MAWGRPEEEVESSDEEASDRVLVWLQNTFSSTRYVSPSIAVWPTLLVGRALGLKNCKSFLNLTSLFCVGVVWFSCIPEPDVSSRLPFAKALKL